jgi:hypothetical protein
MSTQEPQQPNEEQLRARLEEELKKVTVDDVLLQTAVSLVNLGGRKAGLAPGTEGERDLAQVQTAIDGVQALLPLLERGEREEVRPIRDALAQLQMAYAKLSGQPAPEQEAESAAPPKADEPGPAQRSGRLWTPGQ